MKITIFLTPNRLCSFERLPAHGGHLFYIVASKNIKCFQTCSFTTTKVGSLVLWKTHDREHVPAFLKGDSVVRFTLGVFSIWIMARAIIVGQVNWNSRSQIFLLSVCYASQVRSARLWRCPSGFWKLFQRLFIPFWYVKAWEFAVFVLLTSN